MRFGQSLRNATYPPWKSHYIDYSKLKKLLRETDGEPDRTQEASQKDDADEWTERDESKFVEELVNVQLDKVNDFQAATSKQLRERTSSCEHKLDGLLGPAGDKTEAAKETQPSEAEKQAKLQEVLKELDSITKETHELEKYSRINFTGFLKAAKKHDRKRGATYRVRPLLQVRLSGLPFNSEDYSPLLYRLSAMYSFVRQNLEKEPRDGSHGGSESRSGVRRYTTHKFWVHPDNLLEVKIRILRQLPVLVYNPQSSKGVDGADRDPTITSLYFDNPKFSLYTQKVERVSDAASLRLRWFSHLSQKPEITFERKTVKDDDNSEEKKFPIKEKYIQAFIKGEYQMEKTTQKMKDRHVQKTETIEDFQETVEGIQRFIKDNQLQPVLRANYTRTAFQIPGDDRVKISLDTNLALIREDALDSEHPCRNPDDWHRRDIDDAEMEYPFDGVRKEDIARFPYAQLDIKIRHTSRKGANAWVSDLMNSHLVKEAPRFSKFVHGTAQLFEDHVNSFPFWLSELDSDIRKDPEVALVEEQDKKAKRAEDEFAVGSYLAGSRASPAVRPSISGSADSPFSKSRKASKALEADKGKTLSEITKVTGASEPEEPPSNDATTKRPSQPSRGLSSLLPSFGPSVSNSTSKYARAHRALPPGVQHPVAVAKPALTTPINVEPKVWLANQRTFIKWQHISILLTSLSLGLFNAAGADNNLARALAVAYTLLAAFAGLWSWWSYGRRADMIRARGQGGEEEFARVAGGMIVAGGLAVGLVVNWVLRFNATRLENTLLQSVVLNRSRAESTFGVDAAGSAGRLQQVLRA